MTLLCYDINASRIRAVRGPVDDIPTIVSLEPPREDLPLVVSVERGRAEVGSSGLFLFHERPDLVFREFLPFLAGASKTLRRWRPRSHSLDPRKAMMLVFDHLRRMERSSADALFAVPPYLDQQQKSLLTQLAEDARFSVQATVSAPLAQALASHTKNPWTGTVLVIDIDEHALWVSVLQETDGWARLVETFLYPKLSLRRWRHRLLNALADCCILQSRRDPRDFPAAEQSLYLQLDAVMEHCVRNETADIAFQTANWYQHLVLQPEETESFCASLVRPVLADIHTMFDSTWPEKPPTAILISAQAANLPGLAVALEECLDRWHHLATEGAEAEEADSEDFGARLLDANDDADEASQLYFLPEDVAARGAHLIAGIIQQGRLESGHISELAPLPKRLPDDAGPPRVHFQGRDYHLRERNFIMGRRYDCDLVFDRARFPRVGARHCEIIHDPRMYYLKDLSREGTWINDKPVTQPTMLQPGDRIRLGQDGPLVRFLGKPGTAGLTTIA